MGQDTGISWCHHTFNLAWGCTKVSEACRSCYAETWARRYGVGWGPKAERRTFGEKHWAEPLKWNRAAEKAGERRRVFCSSMADVFEDHPTIDAERSKLWDLILETPHLDWLLLTKRMERASAIIRNMDAVLGEPRDGYFVGGFVETYPNVWLGTTAENQECADARIPHLIRTPAAVRFVSAEPLLGPIDLTRIETTSRWPGKAENSKLDALHGFTYSRRERFVLNGIVEEKGVTEFVDTESGDTIAWVIVGGESGSDARPMHPHWARSLRDQCIKAGTAFHFKQWGEWASDTCGAPAYAISRAPLHSFPDHWCVHRIGKKAAGRLLDGVEWNQFPIPEFAR